MAAREKSKGVERAITKKMEIAKRMSLKWLNNLRWVKKFHTNNLMNLKRKKGVCFAMLLFMWHLTPFRWFVAKLRLGYTAFPSCYIHHPFKPKLSGSA
ncbi:hypothetical protein [Xenorhabdus griffiniae]|uniref:hypothetical protein n=1 Tax=Xenorhabdus griffiniae TaxID=351672 RepID=UPI00235A1999|nr:hypothetical protein [Xenorhabdus griffiniae]MDC9606944.1 hypothetical protein [Xenorhabdus griffiniae]